MDMDSYPSEQPGIYSYLVVAPLSLTNVPFCVPFAPFIIGAVVPLGD